MEAAGRYQILITKRLANTYYPGFWELPGGKLEPGESPAHAAVREAGEELGIRIRVAAVLDPIEHTYPHATVRLYPCVAALEAGSPEPRNIHVAEHEWRRLDDLPWDSFLPANVRVITALVRYMESGAGRSELG